jgi:hypothetical protein
MSTELRALSTDPYLLLSHFNATFSEIRFLERCSEYEEENRLVKRAVYSLH